MRDLQAVIFDMDGVLVDSEPWHFEIECKLYKKLGLDVPDEVHLTYIGSANDHMYSDLKRRYDIPMTLQELLEWDAKYRVEVFREMEDIKPNPGLIDLLKALKAANLKIAVATSSVPEVVEIVLEKCKIDSYFDIIVTTEEAGKSKPAPDVFLLAAKKLGVAPENCIIFEDSLNGIKAARSAGIYCIAYQPHNDLQQDASAADQLIHDFNEITPEMMRLSLLGDGKKRGNS
jgi:HAD superfamily hydrolase (TIGR01509 family)